jgi:phage baseplate assembly protein W
VNSLKLTDLAPDKLTTSAVKRGFIFKDIKLDLETSYTYNNTINAKQELNDVQAIYDLEAVKNSIKSAFLTSPGQRILSPLYGIDIRRYVFDTINEDTAFFIERDIEENLPLFEPRIEVSNVRVETNTDENQYDIYLTINVPKIDIYGVTLTNYLNSNGYF